MSKKISFLLLAFISITAYSQELTATIKTDNSVIPGKDIIVELTVNKPGLNGFLKYFQELPEGFSASAIDTKGGDFSFADKGAKIIWVSPPQDNEMIIRYKIITPENASGTLSVGGKFSYILSNERKVFEVAPQIITLGKSASTTKEESTVNIKVNPVSEESKKTETKSEPVPAEKKKEAPVVINPPAKAPTTASTVSPGRTYKVQIGAFAAKPKIEGVYEISTVVLDNGVTKYFSGNFKTYEEAAKRKKEMIEKGFQGAFVVSFENGKIVK